MLRYKFQPETLSVYLIEVKPIWWQRTLFKIIASLIVLSVIFFSLFHFYRKRKKRQLIKQREETEKSMLELKAIRSQLNPHFIFNSLSSIQGLINTNKIESANVYLSEFSNLMRNTLTESDKIFQPLDKEVNMLETYLKIEQLRFQFEYSIKVDCNAELNQIEIPSLLLQPLVENAIKHGVSRLREKGKVDIHFYLKNRNLFAEIEDKNK